MDLQLKIKSMKLENFGKFDNFECVFGKEVKDKDNTILLKECKTVDGYDSNKEELL